MGAIIDIRIRPMPLYPGFFIVAASASENSRPSGHVGKHHDGAGHGGGDAADQNVPVFNMGQLMCDYPHDLIAVHEP